MTRPGLCASRSSTVQRTDAPVPRSVTVTTVPKARVGLAQVPAGAPYHEASPVTPCRGTVGGDDGTGFGLGAGSLGAETTSTDTAEAEVTARGGGGGAAVGVVVVGSTCRNETFTTRVSGPVRATGDAVVDDTSVDDASDRDVERTSSTKPTGVVHDVDRPMSASTTRPRPAPAWYLEPCSVARCGVASRRSGTITKARQHPSCTPYRNPPALRVLRSPPFLCGLHVNCVGINHDAR
jgi:hypothetical protein